VDLVNVLACLAVCADSWHMRIGYNKSFIHRTSSNVGFPLRF